MSYHILYDKQFIKVDGNRVIPFYLGGDNNVYDFNNKRARDWGNSYAHTDKSMIVGNKQLLDSIDDYRKQTIERSNDNVKEYKDESWAYDDKRWGYHTSVAMYGKHTTKTTFSAYRNFYKSGIEQALTIEELEEVGVRITMCVSPYVEDKVLQEKGLERKPSVTFTSTQQMIDAITEYEAYYGGVVILYLHEVGMDWYMIHKKRVRRNAKLEKQTEKKRVTVNEYYVLYNGVGYFIKNKKDGYIYTFNPISSKAFIDEKTIKAFHKRMRNKENFEVKKIEGTRYFWV